MQTLKHHKTQQKITAWETGFFANHFIRAGHGKTKAGHESFSQSQCIFVCIVLNAPSRRTVLFPCSATRLTGSATAFCRNQWRKNVYENQTSLWWSTELCHVSLFAQVCSTVHFHVFVRTTTLILAVCVFFSESAQPRFQHKSSRHAMS